MSSILNTLRRIVQKVFCSTTPSTEPYNDSDKLRLSVDLGPPPDVIITAPTPQSPLYRRPQFTNNNISNQENEHYKDLRARARQEGDAMAKCFEESHIAYQRGDGASAKQLSNEGHEHQRKMNELNSEASEWIFQANNTNSLSTSGGIDLHGLFVKEAIYQTEKAIQAAQTRGDREIRLIVGKGLHSTDHVAKLKPAIEELMQRFNLAAHIDEHNPGVIIVTLNGDSVSGEKKLGSNDIISHIEKQDKDCIIM